MTVYREAISQVTVPLARRDLARMIRLMRLLSRLSENAAYHELVAPLVPDVARFDPGHHAVMMGYDFHLTPQGPRLIEVNTNAGGALLAYLAHFPEAAIARAGLAERLRHQFLAAFAEEMRRFSGGKRQKPAHIVIVDEDPRNQYLYREMVVFTELFSRWEVPSTIADPSALVAGPEGVSVDGEPVDLIYNRHCDFYLERPEMAGIRAAYRAGTVCLTPNPFAYGLLADKRRMTLWSDPEVTGRLGLDQRDADLLRETVPQSRLLADLDREEIWRGRNGWVFKPVSRFGSRGVFLGRKISRTRFESLPAGETLVQRFVSPSVVGTADAAMKADFRLYVYRNRVLGISARLYQGQVTNLRTAGGGFAAVQVVENT